MTNFKDYFSQFSQTYAKGRLSYPPELFAYLSTLTNEHELAWDCGTGNGQAAIGLKENYKKIVATDPSPQQIANCSPGPTITYLVEAAESSSLSDASVDIVTIGIAIHWFDFDLFYAEVQRVLKKGGIIAAWAYFLPTISVEIDLILKKFTEKTLKPFWKPEIKLIHEAYKTIPFPFDEISPPDFVIQKRMNLEDFIEHMHTWSAVQYYMNEKDSNPVEVIYEELLAAWGSKNEEREIIWKMPLRVGRNN
jgi:ubiquinone/menaquinone biosynthesis C-methylase UbiE